MQSVHFCQALRKVKGLLSTPRSTHHAAVSLQLQPFCLVSLPRYLMTALYSVLPCVVSPLLLLPLGVLPSHEVFMSTMLRSCPRGDDIWGVELKDLGFMVSFLGVDSALLSKVTTLSLCSIPSILYCSPVIENKNIF